MRFRQPARPHSVSDLTDGSHFIPFQDCIAKVDSRTDVVNALESSFVLSLNLQPFPSTC